MEGALAEAVAAGRARNRPQPPAVPPVAAALALAVEPVAAATAETVEMVPPADPGRPNQKARLVARILAAVADPDFHPSIAGRAADLVTVHGLPPADLKHILADMAAMRDAGRLTSPGGFFHAKARELAARHGLPWPNPKTTKARPR